MKEFINYSLPHIIIVDLENGDIAVYQSTFPAIGKETFKVYGYKSVEKTIWSSNGSHSYYKKEFGPKGSITMIQENNTWIKFIPKHEPGGSSGNKSKYRSIGEGLYKAKTIWFD